MNINRPFVGEGAFSDSASETKNSNKEENSGGRQAVKKRGVSWADVVAGNARQQKLAYLVAVNEHQKGAHSLETIPLVEPV
jgi:hypothetical protein